VNRDNESAEPNQSPHPLLEGLTRYHGLVFFGCWLGGIFDGMDSTLMSVAGPKAIAELLHTADQLAISQTASLVGSVFLLGWMFGGVIFGMIGDKLGRVRSMLLSILLYAAFTGLAGLAQTWPQLAFCRFLTGLGIGGELVSIATLLTEIWPARSRAIAVGTLITSYQAGVFLAGGISTLFTGWRETFWLGALPAVLVFFLRRGLRESETWLEAQETQKQTLQEQGGQNDKMLTLPANRLLAPQNRRALWVGSLAFGSLLIGYWASLSWIPFWVNELLQGHGAGNERGIATMTQGLGAIIGCILAGLAAERFGRRLTIVLSSLGCFLASCFLFLSNRTFSPFIYAGTATLGLFIGLMQAVMYIYLPELFPTLIRASGTGFCLNIGRFVTALVVFFVGDIIRWLTQFHWGDGWLGQGPLSTYASGALLFSLSYLVSMIAAALGVETKNRELLK
jgi:MFS family permease